MGSKLNIKSRHGEFSAKVEIGGNQYIVQTEDMGEKTRKIVTRTYFNGAIISSVTTDYSLLGNSSDLKDRVKEMMEEQQKAALAALSTEESKPEESKPTKSKAQYADKILRSIKKGDLAAALAEAREALALYATDLLFTSYYGYLITAVERKVKEGQKICEEAIESLRNSSSTDKAFFYPLFYLNLGRAFTAGRRKKEAIEAFQEGLKYDSRNKELLHGVNQFGVRRPPIISFLDRSHPLNKHLGRLRQRLTNR